MTTEDLPLPARTSRATTAEVVVATALNTATINTMTEDLFPSREDTPMMIKRTEQREALQETALVVHPVETTGAETTEAPEEQVEQVTREAPLDSSKSAGSQWTGTTIERR